MESGLAVTGGFVRGRPTRPTYRILLSGDMQSNGDTVLLSGDLAPGHELYVEPRPKRIQNAINY